MPTTLLTAAGEQVGVVSATVCLPRIGAWHADLIGDQLQNVTGRCTLQLAPGISLSGTVFRGGVYRDTWYARVVAGAAGLGQLAAPRFFERAPCRAIFDYLLGQAGEARAAGCDATFLATSLRSWTVLRGAVGQALAALAAFAGTGLSWRVQQDGTVWIGREGWPAATLSDWQETDRQPHLGSVEIATEEPLLMPGCTLSGERVSYVQHTIDSGRVRTRFFTETGSA